VEREEDFRLFAYWHALSGDIDPVYPVLGVIGGWLCEDEDDLISLVLLYVAYYNLGSTLATWLEGWRPGKELDDVQVHRATGTERRGHRNIVRFHEHIAGLALVHERFGSWKNALWPGLNLSREQRWTLLEERLMRIRGNGRWAAYKTGEMLKMICEWDVAPTDAGHAHSSGPRHGLVDLFPELSDMTGNDGYIIGCLNDYTERLVELTGHPVEQVETHLCDWHSTLKGNYYVGHDIDLMLNQLGPSTAAVRELVMNARSDSFDDAFRGEVEGWPGVRKELNHLYRTTGKIEWWQ
jgi:hypothetical protein